MPAAQTLLLFANEIDTNGSCSKIICDSWLCLEFPHPETGMVLLQKACQLRGQWNKLLNQRLEALATKTVEGELSKPKREEQADAIEQELWMQLANFMNTEIYYTIRRVLPAELKTTYEGYNGPSGDSSPLVAGNPFEKDYECHENMVKGGWWVMENVTVNW